jgi:hypothetical protein
MADEPRGAPAYIDLGATGLKRYGTISLVYEEFLRQLSPNSIRGVQIYTEMSMNDPVVGSILYAIEMLIRQVAWTVQPATTDEEDIEKAQFVESCMDDMSSSWNDTISEILSMLVYGWSWHEIVYKRRMGDTDDPKTRSRYNDGLIGWRKLPIRGQDTLYNWEFDESGGVQAMWQISPPTYQSVRIPIEKSLLFRTKVRKGNPEGMSILRNAFRPWYFKKRLEEIEGIGVERDLAGLPVAFVPPEIMNPQANASERAIFEQIRKIVTNIRRDEQEGVIFPMVYDSDGRQIYDLKLLTTGGQRQFNTNDIIKRYDQRIAMVVLADILLMGQDKVGSYALSSNKTELFLVAITSWLDSIASVFNRYAIPRLFKLNGWPTDRLPCLNHGSVEMPDLDALGRYIMALAGVGAPLFPDDALEDYLRSAAHLPPKTKEE